MKAADVQQPLSISALAGYAHLGAGGHNSRISMALMHGEAA